jgi:oligopeptide/dipeptide ABC transporter ATP-binding protein
MLTETPLSPANLLVDARNLSKYYTIMRPFSRSRYTVKAVDRVNLQIQRGQVFGLVGESGCGKSTIGRLLLRLVEATSGQVMFNGKDVLSLKGEGLAEMRRAMQIVFQDPYSSLNPAFNVRTILWEGLSKVPGANPRQADEPLGELMERVGLSREYLRAFPHELSGGQRQRVGVARALSVNPQFLVADEPTSALDVSIQAQILDLFIELQQKLGLAMLFISHDFSVVRYLCEQVAVMYLGQIVEQGNTRDVLDHPRHPYTAGLLSSIPRIEQRGTRERRLLAGELPSPTNLPSGCRFHPRCAFAQDRCKQQEPPLVERAGGHDVACFFPLEG